MDSERRWNLRLEMASQAVQFGAATVLLVILLGATFVSPPSSPLLLPGVAYAVSVLRRLERPGSEGRASPSRAAPPVLGAEAGN